MATHTICSDYLTMLGVPHTACFTDRRFTHSPYAGTLIGFQDLLDEYDVATKMSHFPDKTGLDTLKVPFVAMVLGKLVIVTSVTADKVTVVTDGDLQTVDRAEFVKKWNGRALEATPGKESGEPELKHHRQILAVSVARRWGIAVSLAVIFLWLFIANGLYHNVGAVLVAIFDLIGIYICYLLLGKQLHISSKRADAVCGFLEKGGCGKIMDRNVSKIFGVIGWGEVGMAYFSVSLIALVAYPPCLGYLAFFNACCLPYTVWSISYQKFVAKTWCTLCVTVQTLQWLLFGSYLLADAWHGLWPLHASLFILGFGYLLALLVIDRLMPVVAAAHDDGIVSDRYDNLRLNTGVFDVEQSQQPSVAPVENSGTILFGDTTQAPHVIIFSDPYSASAAQIYHQADMLLKKGMTVGYVFLNNSAEREAVNRRLIAMYQTIGAEKAWEAMGEWFDRKDKNLGWFLKFADNSNAAPDNSAKRYDANSADVDASIAAQKKWQQDSYLMIAPTIIVDGRILSPVYTLPDLLYIY